MSLPRFFAIGAFAALLLVSRTSAALPGEELGVAGLPAQPARAPGPRDLESLRALVEARRKSGEPGALAEAYADLAAAYRGCLDWERALGWNAEALALFERLKDRKRSEECRAFGREIEAERRFRPALEEEIRAAEADLLSGELERAFGLALKCASFGAYGERTAPILGRYHFLKGQYAKAASYYGRAIKLQPWRGEHYVGLAEVKLAQKDPEEAARWMEAGRGILPEKASTYCCLGQIEYARRNFTDSIAAFERAIELDPDMTKAWKQLIATYEALYDRVSAREYAERLAERLRADLD